MDLEALVRAAGNVMGLARDSFGLGMGTGAGSMSTLGPSPALALDSWSGQAASAFNDARNVVNEHVSALTQQNLATTSDLESALNAAGTGRAQMGTVIEAALADITSLAPSTTTFAGRQAVVNALASRLEQTRQSLTNGNADASTRAASSAQIAAAYNGLGNSPSGGLPLAGATSPLQNMSMMPAAMMPAAMMPAASMASMQQLASTPFNGDGSTNGNHAILTSAITQNGGQAKAIPVTAVQYTRSGVGTGPATCKIYINQALDAMGIANPAARNSWASGLLVAMSRESNYNPLAVNGWDSNAHGPQVADGYPSGSSRGLMQTIPTTFAANHQPGTSTNIYNPVANICAAMNYVMNRYGVSRNGSNLGTVGQFNPNDAPGGY
jgi:Transglycosylase SLT domain